MKFNYILLFAYLCLMNNFNLIGMDDQGQTLLSQQTTQPITLGNLWKGNLEFQFIGKNVGCANDRLHTSCTMPVNVSFHDCSKANAAKENNLPDPQFWIKEKKESDQMVDVLRYSFDRPDGQDGKSINVSFIFNRLMNNKPKFLFDGPNKQNNIACVYIDEVYQTSALYLMPAGNKKDLKDDIYDASEVEQFKIKDINGCVTALALLQEVNKILYCYTEAVSVSSGSSSSSDDTSISTHHPCIVTIDGDENDTIFESKILKPLKKILCIAENKYFGLSADNLLMFFTQNKDESITALESIKTQIDGQQLAFQDIAIDPDNKNMAFLDIEGKIYIAQTAELDDLQHVYTLDKIKKNFVERIAYHEGIVTVIYQTTADNKLLRGCVERLSKYKTQEQIELEETEKRKKEETEKRKKEKAEKRKKEEKARTLNYVIKFVGIASGCIIVPALIYFMIMHMKDKGYGQSSWLLN